jgi:hypothetical protein
VLEKDGISNDSEELNVREPLIVDEARLPERELLTDTLKVTEALCENEGDQTSLADALRDDDREDEPLFVSVAVASSVRVWSDPV